MILLCPVLSQLTGGSRNELIKIQLIKLSNQNPEVRPLTKVTGSGNYLHCLPVVRAWIASLDGEKQKSSFYVCTVLQLCPIPCSKNALVLF